MYCNGALVFAAGKFERPFPAAAVSNVVRVLYHDRHGVQWLGSESSRPAGTGRGSLVKSVLPPELVAHLGEMPQMGVLLLGENGYTFGDPWKDAEYIKLKDEKKVSSILNHAATKAIPQTLPRMTGHVKEWVDACTGGPATFSSFEVGGHLTEIALSGVVALRTQKTLVWNGEKMRAENAPEAQQFIQPHYRTGWTI